MDRSATDLVQTGYGAQYRRFARTVGALGAGEFDLFRFKADPGKDPLVEARAFADLQDGLDHFAVLTLVMVFDLVDHAGIVGLEVFTQEAHTEYRAHRDMRGTDRQAQVGGDDDRDGRCQGDTEGAGLVQFGDLGADGTDQLGAVKCQTDRDTDRTDHHDP